MIFGSVCLFILYPLICVVLRSLQTGNGISLEYYLSVWETYNVSLGRSIFVGFFSSIFCTIISLFFSIFISTRKGWQKVFFTALLIIILVSPPFVSSLAYIQLYGRRGWITYRLLNLDWMPYNKWGIILMQTISFVPLNTLILNGLLSKIDTSAINAAKDLGAKVGNILRDIVLPVLKPGIFVCLLLTFVRSLADYGTPAIIGGKYRTLATQIYVQFMGAGDLSKAAAMNVLLCVPSIIAFIIYRRLMKKNNTSSVRSVEGCLNIKLSKSIFGNIIIGFSLLYSLIMALQYISIFLSSVVKTGSFPFKFTTDYIQSVFTYNTEALMRSLFVAVIVSVLGTLFSMLFAYYVDRRKIKLGGFFDCVVTLPYMIPSTCFGIGYILAFNDNPIHITGTLFIIIMCILFRLLSTTTKICSAALTKLSIDQERSAQDLGAGRLYIIKDVVLPNLRPVFVTCVTYCFTSAMTMAGAILFLISPKTLVAVFRLFDAISVGEYGVASVIASLIIVVVFVVEELLFFVSNKLEKRYVSRT